MNDEYITVADLKRYAWCPRIIYYTHVLHLDERITDAMEIGKEEHDESILAPVIANVKGKRVIKEPFIVNETLRIVGKPDYIIETKLGELIPVEIKYSSAEKYVKSDHKLQLAIYALLIEEEYKKIVKRAIVYYLLSKKIMKVDISSSLKRDAINAIKVAYKIIENEEFPKVKQPKSKCVNCGYFRYCYP